MYKIAFRKSAAKEFLLLPVSYQEKVENALKLLASNTIQALDIKMLVPKNEGRYRMRVGKYRVIYSYREHILTIDVIKIGSRWDVYK